MRNTTIWPISLWLVCASCSERAKHELEAARRELEDVKRELQDARAEFRDVERELGQATREAGRDVERELHEFGNEVSWLMNALDQQFRDHKPDQSAQPQNRVIEGAKQAIECTGERCVIKWPLLENFRKNPNVLLTQGRLVPSSRASERGLELQGILPDSVPALLGFRDGDLIVAVQGRPVHSIADLLALEKQVAGQSEIEVEFRRDGKRMTRRLATD